MSVKPKLLDLCCCEGGASWGYHQLGFDVTGVDIAPQPLYPLRFIQADALQYVESHWREYDYIHASPPCQKFSDMMNIRPDADAQRAANIDLLTPIAPILRATGKPFVIENVPGAASVFEALDFLPIMLCGTMFKRPYSRHRLFASNLSLVTKGVCRHEGTVDNGAYMGMYSEGGAAWIDPDDHSKGRRKGSRKVEDWRAALECDWLSKHGCRQAIPPIYTRWIGAQLLNVLQPRLL